MSKQSTLKRPKMPASAGSQVESSGAVGLSARSGAPLAERKSRESSRAPSLGRMKGDRAPSQRAPGQRRVASAATGSRVSTLARHFDRMSREAERDRNKKLAALRSKRAKPVGVSKAVIEVYADAREALREDSDESDVEDAEGAGADDEADDAELSRLQATSPKGKSRGALYCAWRNAPNLLSLVVEREKTVTAPTENESAPTSKNEQIPAESSTFPVEPAFERIVPSSLTSSTPVSPGLPPSSMPSSSKAAPQSESEMSSSGTEKSSIMKTISSLWGARNCEFVPLAYPL